jgi:protein-S-isoprenylcysteine O-methyltransferase Ste14
MPLDGNHMTDQSKPQNPGVRFPPPFLYLLGLGAAWILETRVSRIRLVGGSAPTAPLETAGVAIMLAGFVLMFWGLLTFARVRTGIIPMRPATRIVSHGPYRFSRNPMYAGMALAYLGGALLMNSGWSLILLPLVMLGIYQLVIKREERYLNSAFPVEYGEYRKRVRRWL